MMLSDLEKQRFPAVMANKDVESAADNGGNDDGAEWVTVSRLLDREISRLIEDKNTPCDVRISAIHACVDRKYEAPLPYLRAIALNKSLVSTLRKVAIHAIGELGTQDDRRILKELNSSSDNLRLATEPALKALAVRTGAN